MKKNINGFPIHPVGIGTWLMGGGMFTDKIPFAVYGGEEKEIEAIRYSLSKGQNHIDTAQMYGMGHTEEIVGNAIQGFDRSKIFLASKIWRTHALRLSVVKQVAEMLKRLQTTYLDLLYMHAPWPEVDLEQCIQGINDAVDRGLVRAVGVSNFNLEQVEQAIAASKYPIAALQNHYSLTYRSEFSPELRALCRTHTITFVAYKPLERKKLTDNPLPLITKLAKKYQKTPAQVILNWVISQEGVVAIPKASWKKHIDENLGALTFEIEEKDKEVLDNLSSL